jgi:hypothetical protein
MNVQSLASAAVALVVATGTLPCTSTASYGGDQGPMLDFELTGSAPADATVGPAVESAAAGSVEISGVISTPNPCYEVDAELRETGGKLELTLTARSKGGICPQVVGRFAYRARISSLAAGDHELVTVYRYPETGWEEQQYTLQIQVPETDGR